MRKQRRKVQRLKLPLSNGGKAVLPAALRNRDAWGITPPQPLRLEMLTDVIKATNKLESVLQSTVATSCVSNVGKCCRYISNFSLSSASRSRCYRAHCLKSVWKLMLARTWLAVPMGRTLLWACATEFICRPLQKQHQERFIHT